MYNKSEIMKSAWNKVRYEQKSERVFNLDPRPVHELLAEALKEAWLQARLKAGTASEAEKKAPRIKVLKLEILSIENCARFGSPRWNSMDAMKAEIRELEAA